MNIFVKVITIAMLGMSVWSFYVIFERFLTFGSASQQNLRYVQALGEYLRQNRVADAHSAAKSMTKSPVARVMESGLGALQQGREALTKSGPNDVGNFDLVDAVNRALERVKERETSDLRKGLPFLNAFQLLKGGGTIDTIGPAIAEALIATAVGLGVAIIAAMAFNYFTARVEKFVVDLNDVSSEFVDYVLKEGR
jgi:biopolymer transport protein ExbB/TolQ